MNHQFKPADFSDFAEVLHHHATSRGETRFFSFLDKNGEQVTSHSFAEMDAAARGVAQTLLQSTNPGQRILLLLDPGADFVAGLFGCWYAGLIPIPVLPPGGAGAKRAVPRLRVIVRDADCDVVLTNRKVLDIVRELDSQWANQGRWVCSENTSPSSTTGRLVPYAGHSCLLQYTSGSTGKPKGVELTHQNMLENSASIQGAFGHSQKSQTVFWLPPQHDMGLVGGILQPAYVGFPTVHMSPMTFLQRPIRWLQAISRYQATTAGGPDFAFRMCAERISQADKEHLDLRSWTVAFSGSETVRPDTLEVFAEAFRECGFSKMSYLPCYGLAEATLMVTGKRAESEAGPLLVHADRNELGRGEFVEAQAGEDTTVSLTSCGPKMPGQDIAIVQPGTLNEVPEGMVGEVLCSGANVARGYYGREEETRSTFDLRVKGREGAFMNTGDLGFLQGGELFLAGRSKDLIIVRGQNHYPGDLEATTDRVLVANEFTIGSVCAFSEELDGEKITLCVELRGTRERANKLVQGIADLCRDALAKHHGVRPSRLVLVRPGSLLKTTSGKLQRAGCRRALRDGEIEVVEELTFEEAASFDERVAPPPTSAPEIRDWLVRYAARKKGVLEAAIDPAAPFTSFGLDSLEAVSLASDLAAWTGQQVPATALWEYPNILALSEFLHPKEEAEEVVRPLQSSRGGGGIAIVGMACRTPGARSLGEFWDLLRNGDRPIAWADSQRPGANELNALNLQGGYIDSVERFDAALFGIAPDEARLMDPQHRLLLQSTWEALESAGYRPSDASGSATGVYVGISNADYSRQLSGKACGPLVGTGNALSLAANRISYQFNFVGPSLAVDTACSSSLVAVHLACRALESEECNAAVAAGVNLLLDSEVTSLFESAGMLSASSRCHTFREAADGYVRGEGCGVVVLKRLEDAVRNGDRIYSVIQGTSVNQDGHSNGVTAPNLGAQRACIEAALAKAKLTGGSVDYVETHGTGTPLGDPIEVQALAEVLTREPGAVALLGAVKANIGHLESAAGIVGLVKTSLVLWHQMVPGQPGAGPLNPRLNLPEYMRVADREAHEGIEVAGVSAFGFGGTNAHAVLVPRPTPESEESDALGEHPLLLMLSANSRRSLTELAARYRDAIARGGWRVAKAISQVTLTRRERLRMTEYVAADDLPALLEQLDSVEGELREFDAPAELKWHCGTVRDPAGWVLSWSSCFPLVQCAFEELRGPFTEFGEQGEQIAAHLAVLASFESVGCRAALVSGDRTGALAAALWSSGLRGEQATKVARYCLGQVATQPDDLYARAGCAYSSEGTRLDRISVDALRGSMAQGDDAQEGIVIGSVSSKATVQHEETGSELGALKLLALAEQSNLSIDWEQFLEGWVGQTSIMPDVDVPTYAFDEERYWFEDLALSSSQPKTLGLSWKPHKPTSASVPEAKKWLLVGADTKRLRVLRDGLISEGYLATSCDLSCYEAILAAEKELAGVVFLSSCQGANNEDVHSAVQLARALQGRASLRGGLRLVTQGLFADSRVLPSIGGGVWGAMRSFKNEHPFANIQLVDCDEIPEANTRALSRLLGEKPDREIRLSGSEALTPQLTPVTGKASARTIRWDQGAVVVSGGLGALGLALAEALLAQGCRHLVLLGRDRNRGAVEVDRLRREGVSVTVRSVNVNDADQVQEAIAHVAVEFGLCGVIHAAGVLRDGLWENQTRETMDAVWAPKAIGTEQLWTAARPHHPQFFCCVSSLAAVLGSPGQGPYAAANTQMESMARDARAAGVAVTSIALGPVEGTSMWQRAERSGTTSPVALLSIDQATAAVLEAITSDDPWRVVTGAPRDSAQLAQSLSKASQLLVEEWLGVDAQAETTELLRELKRGNLRRESRISEWIRERIAEALHADPGSVPSNKGLLELGLDSLAVLQLRNRLQQELQVSVPPTTLFEYPTIERLALHLVSLTFGTDAVDEVVAIAPSPTGEVTSDEFWNEIEELEEREAVRLIGED